MLYGHINAEVRNFLSVCAEPATSLKSNGRHLGFWGLASDAWLNFDEENGDPSTMVLHQPFDKKNKILNVTLRNLQNLSHPSLPAPAETEGC